jgi:hypothetical protein
MQLRLPVSVRSEIMCFAHKEKTFLYSIVHSIIFRKL